MASVGVSTTDRLQTPSTALTSTLANVKVVLFLGMSRRRQVMDMKNNLPKFFVLHENELKHAEPRFD